jgi:TM2 domain-containing membrane protein YozV
MSDAELLLLVKSREKSGFVAALLNLFFPGAGYMYCGRWILGIAAFLMVVGVAFVMPIASISFIVILFIDGFLSAGRYNRNLITKMLKERAIASGDIAAT